ncbi:MAG: hypothetical protein KTR30_30185 [Saprospiraceae bacterium]|nr:hypothetical protein [Saprospiraceae bacterium]
MKTIKSVLISAAMSLLFVNTALANNYIPVIKVVDHKLHLSLDHGSAKAAVKIQDLTGATVLEENVVASEQFESVFSLEQLPQGAYILTVISEHQEMVQPISITNEGVRMDENQRAAYFPASVSKKKGKLNLSLLNPTRSDVQLIVMDMRGNIQFQETIEGEAIIEKGYKLKQVPNGFYTIIVDNGKRVYTKQMTL